MLKKLEIQNLALIENLSIDFSSKLNVLTGETGAGKSIIIDALNFVIGGKANKNLIKSGKDFTKVQALFCNLPELVLNKLKEYDIEVEDEIILSRKLKSDGKTESKINGLTVTTLMLKNITSLLIDIHGQHEHQHILQTKYHLGILDSFIKDKAIFIEYENNLSELKNINNSINKLNGSTENQERLLDLLSYQINEIEKSNLKPNEDEELSSKKLKMQNSGKIYSSLENSIDCLDGQQSCVNSIKKISSLLEDISKYDEEFLPLIERINSAKYELVDILETLKAKKAETTFNQVEFDSIDERLDKIKSLKRKYGPTLEDVFSFYEKSKYDYDEILNSKDKLKELLKQKNEILLVLYNIAKNISDIRKNISDKFVKDINKELADLGMKNARFAIEFLEFPNFESFEKNIKPSGADEISFLFSANLGQSLKPLSEIVSGGEASRFMLAFKNILANVDGMPSMVFDEIDTGISGEMGYKVACKMANIGLNHQVMAVSHLPQICAMANENIKISKYVKDNQTVIEISYLKNKELLNEIARLSGGEQDNKASIEHALELQKRCENFKKSL